MFPVRISVDTGRRPPGRRRFHFRDAASLFLYERSEGFLQPHIPFLFLGFRKVRFPFLLMQQGIIQLFIPELFACQVKYTASGRVEAMVIPILQRHAVNLSAEDVLRQE